MPEFKPSAPNKSTDQRCRQLLVGTVRARFYLSIHKFWERKRTLHLLLGAEWANEQQKDSARKGHIATAEAEENGEKKEA